MTNELTNHEHGLERERVVLNVKHNYIDAVETLVSGEAVRFFQRADGRATASQLYVLRLNEDTSIAACDCEDNEIPIQANDIVNGVFYPEVYVNK